MIELSSKKKRINLCERSEQKIFGKFALFKSSLANVKSHYMYLFSVLQNDIHCILGSEKGGPGPLGPPLNPPLLIIHDLHFFEFDMSSQKSQFFIGVIF